MNGRKLLDDIYAKSAANSGGGSNNQSAKLVVTERPFTPKPRERHLYPATAAKTNRPQSGSIHLQLIEEESAGGGAVR